MSRTYDRSDLRARLKHMGFSIYVDLRRFGEALRERLPWPTARRRAEYVLIDGKRVPISLDAAEFERKYLRDVKVQDGLGFRTHQHSIRALHSHAPPGGQKVPAPRPAHGPSTFARQDRQPPSPHL